MSSINNNDKMKALSKQALQEALKRANDESVASGGKKVPYSHKSIIILEKKGVIPVKGITYEGRPGVTRIYTEKEIEQIVEKVVKYVNRKK